MTIRAKCGKVGAGKSYVGAWEAASWLKRGRGVASSYSIHGCKYLLTMADALSDQYRGYFFIVDEVGGKLSSRKGDQADQLTMEALQQSRHNLIDADLLMQHPRQLDIVARELIAEYHFVTRVGPDGEIEQRTGRRGLFTHPWLHLVTTYLPDDFDDDWQTKPGRRFRSVYVVPWLRAVAESYNSWDRIVSDDQVAWLRALQETAQSRFDLPAAIVRGGKVVPQILPPGYSLLMPPKRLLRARGKGEEGVPVPVPAGRDYLASLGLYHAGDDAAPAAVLVDGEAVDGLASAVAAVLELPIRDRGTIPFEGVIRAVVPSSDAQVLIVRPAGSDGLLELAVPLGVRVEPGRALRCRLRLLEQGSGATLRIDELSSVEVG